VSTISVSQREQAQHTAQFWEALRRFLRRSERIARKHGLTPQRHQLLVMIKGTPDGSERSTVTELADRLQLAQNTVTELVDRAEGSGLVTRQPSATDGRIVHIGLSDEGERRIQLVMAELRSDREILEAVLSALAEPAN
jgi:DNA-binding MarR family transcriptional regulator